MELSELTKLISEKVASLGYELISLNNRVEKGENILSIVVDRVEPIDMDTFDISSLGAEKPLRIEELDKYVNRFVHVHLINPINGENIYEGDLSEIKEDKIKLTYRIKTRIKTVDIIKTNISKIRLAIKF